MDEFKPFPSIPRWSRDIVITEKLDGTNAQVLVTPEGQIRAGSRNRWITALDDNHGFAKWVENNKDELQHLGPGLHYGEWWGAGIQRRYNLTEKRFSLFNVGRWNQENIPACCSVVPTLYEGPLSERAIWHALEGLKLWGSSAAPGFMNPEGIVIYHTAANSYFKKTLENDEGGKGGKTTTPQLEDPNKHVHTIRVVDEDICMSCRHTVKKDKL